MLAQCMLTVSKDAKGLSKIRPISFLWDVVESAWCGVVHG